MSEICCILIFFTVFTAGLAFRKNSVYTGIYELTFYSGGEDAVSFCEAQRACVLVGSHLAMLKERYIQNATNDLLKNWGNAFIPWIGGTDQHSEGYWTWIDGIPLDNGYTNWRPNQPDDYGNEWFYHENCLQVVIGDTMQWNDANCTKKYGYICQKDVTKALNDDYSELDYSNSAVDDQTLARATKQKSSFAFAQKECEKDGARLVEMNNALVNKLHKRLTGNTALKYWVKGIEENGRWKWNNNDDIDSQKWAPTYPTGIGSNRCLVLGLAGVEDQDCDKSFDFICESIRSHGLKISDERPIISVSHDIKIDCSASGYPHPDVTWYRENKKVSDLAQERIHQVITTATSSLVINNVEFADEGRYHCIAGNIHNNVNNTISGFADIKVLSSKVDPSFIEGWKIKANTDTTQSSCPTETQSSSTAKNSSEWLIPVLSSIIAILLLVLLGTVIALVSMSDHQK